MAVVPTLDKFAEVLNTDVNWYDLGVMLGASVGELSNIQSVYEKRGVITCLVQLYDCLEKKGKDLSWKTIATSLDRLNSKRLADKIRSEYIWPLVDHSRHRSRPVPDGQNTSHHHLMVPHSSSHVFQSQYSACSTDSVESNNLGNTVNTSARTESTVAVVVVREIAKSYVTLVERLATLILKIKETFEKSPHIDVSKIQDLSEDAYGLSPLPSDQATFDIVFNRVKKQCSILNFRIIVFLAKTLLTDSAELVHELVVLEAEVEKFKSSVHMEELITEVKATPIENNELKIVKLKVRDFWNDFTLKQFEMMVTELFQTLHDMMFHMTVTKGCICATWSISNNHTTKFIVQTSPLPSEFLKAIGIISLHIGSKAIHSFEGTGCETIEAAMLQAVELRNTRAIELFLSMGCDPVMSTYNNQYTVTNIVNIIGMNECEAGLASTDGGHDDRGSVHHVCVIGHNEHVAAIVDTSHQPQCSTCSVTEKVNRQLYQEIDTLRNRLQIQEIHHEQLSIAIDTLHESLKDKDLEVEQKADEVKSLCSKLKYKEDELQLSKHVVAQNDERKKKIKDAEIVLLKKSNEILIIENQSKEKEIMELRNKIAKLQMTDKTASPCTAVLPCKRMRLGIGSVMKVIVTTQGGLNGQHSSYSSSAGSDIKASLSCNVNECPVVNNNDGTYTIQVVPQQLGQHQLSVTVDNHHIQGSPFTLDIVPPRDYTQLNKSIQTITGVKLPMYMAFANNGDMYITSNSDHCIHVYDKSGTKKTIIGADGSGELEFEFPRGIDISGDIVYVAEHDRHRIYQLSLEGKVIGIFGEKGSKVSQFNCPSDVKVSPDGRVYVADTHNDRVQVFNSDWSISHVIDGAMFGFSRPMGIAFDLLGNVHVTGIASSSIMVFTSNGQFVREHDNKKVHSPTGIAIDSSGNSLVNDLYDGSLSVFNPQGVFVHSIGDFNNPYGVSVSPLDGSVWVADWLNDKLVKH